MANGSATGVIAFSWPVHPKRSGALVVSHLTEPTMADKHSRSVVKAISWRVTGTIDTIVISYLITGHAKWALSIGFVELFTKIFLYYAHERVWNRLSFGRVKTGDDFTI